ncbi:MAG: hypothetical protein WCP87_06200, partial [Atribacterota bacterium]
MEPEIRKQTGPGGIGSKKNFSETVGYYGDLFFQVLFFSCGSRTGRGGETDTPGDIESSETAYLFQVL